MRAKGGFEALRSHLDHRGVPTCLTFPMPAGRGVLRPMREQDLPAVVAIQEPASVAGLPDVFPHERYPFPRDEIAARWQDEVADPDIECFVVEEDGRVAGFAALQGGEVLHFGTALDMWGSGLATAAPTSSSPTSW